MANGSTHQTLAALVVGGVYLHNTPSAEGPVLKAVLGGALAAFFTNVPDHLEPAIHPHHRQFFHSIAFAAVLGIAGQQIYGWNPEEDWQKVLRSLLLVGSGAYLIHLAIDACSSRSLPLFGKM